MSDRCESGTERSDCCGAEVKEAFYGKRICSDCRSEVADPPTTKDQHLLSGVCDLCGEAIYTVYDHEEGCIYGQ